MQGLSERQYAAHVGLPRGAIQNAKRGGRLVFHADRSINVALSRVRRADMTDPDRQCRLLGGDTVLPAGGSSGTDSLLIARAALTVCQAKDRHLAIQKKKGTLVDRARAETLVFRLARQERDTWVTWPARVAALMAAEVAAEVEEASGKPLVTEAATLQRVLDAHVRAQLEALADLRVSLA